MNVIHIAFDWDIPTFAQCCTHLNSRITHRSGKVLGGFFFFLRVLRLKSVSFRLNYVTTNNKCAPLGLASIRQSIITNPLVIKEGVPHLAVGFDGYFTCGLLRGGDRCPFRFWA